MGSGAGRKEEAAGAGGLSVGEGAGERNFLDIGWARQGPKEKDVGGCWAQAGAGTLVLVATTLIWPEGSHFPSLGLSFLFSQMTASDPMSFEGPYS